MTVERDRYGRPLVIPPDSGKPVAYTRCTTYVGCLEDTYALTQWKMRQVALGLSMRKDLLLSVAAHKDDKDALNKACADAMEAAQSSAAATTGTALHSLTEQFDRGTLNMSDVPSDYVADIAAYSHVMTKGGLGIEAIEQFGVHDELRIGGTWDRVVTKDGKRYIADLKTGSIQYGMLKIAMQLAVYSRCAVYEDGARTPLDVEPDKAIVIHLPAGTGKAFLHWVDIDTGWEAVRTATDVRAWRAIRGLSEAFEYSRVEVDVEDLITPQINACTEITDLRALWARNQQAWTQAHTDAARARTEEIRNNPPKETTSV